MRKVAASLVVLGFASSAWAGSVGFGGSPQNILVDSGVPAVFEVSVSATDLAEFDSISLLIGSDDGLTISAGNWTYDPAFVARLSGAPTPPGAFGVFPADLNVGGSDFSAPLFAAPLVIGTLSIPTQGLAEGTYEVFVNSSVEEGLLGFALSVAAAGFTQEGLAGVGTVNIVPEPATLVMLGMGGLAAAYRRRK